MNMTKVLSHQIEGFNPSNATVTIEENGLRATGKGTGNDPVVAFRIAEENAKQIISKKRKSS